MDLDQRTQGLNDQPGRVIYLGDGTEVLTDGDDVDMFDQDEEDKDLDAQVTRGQVGSNDEDQRLRSEREATPGPESKQEGSERIESSPVKPNGASARNEGDDSALQASPVSIKSIPESAIPEKLVSPDTTT